MRVLNLISDTSQIGMLCIYLELQNKNLILVVVFPLWRAHDHFDVGPIFLQYPQYTPHNIHLYTLNCKCKTLCWYLHCGLRHAGATVETWRNSPPPRLRRSKGGGWKNRTPVIRFGDGRFTTKLIPQKQSASSALLTIAGNAIDCQTQKLGFSKQGPEAELRKMRY